LRLADPLQLATGLSQKQLRQAGKANPQQVAELQTLIGVVNAWNPKELLAALENELAADDQRQSLHEFAPDLVAAGHDPERVWDYTPEQFLFYWRAARRAQLAAHQQFVQGVVHAIAGCLNKEGAKLLDVYTTRIESALKHLAEPATEAPRG
jgi:hypothetical protein